jgi:hypothetical protein
MQACAHALACLTFGRRRIDVPVSLDSTDRLVARAPGGQTAFLRPGRWSATETGSLLARLGIPAPDFAETR